jgi:hypothetical protein
VNHPICQFHSEQTLKRRVKGSQAANKARKHLIAALKYRKTKPGCKESIQAAINEAPERLKNYIEKKWWDTRELWAFYARQHSPLLLQIPTTSPVESWHSVLKCKAITKSQLARFSLLGIAKHIMAYAKNFDLRATKVKSSFKTRVLPLVAEFPQLKVFLFPVQKLLAPAIVYTVFRVA